MRTTAAVLASRAERFTVEEVHIVRGDGHFVLQAYAPVDDEKRALPEMDAAIQAFSWIGPVSDTGSEYLNYGLGIRVGRPRKPHDVASS